MRRFILTMTAAAAMALATGCQVVSNTKPVGAPAPTVATSLEGVWKVGDGVVFAKATATPGELRLGMLEWTGKQWELKQHTLRVGQLNDAHFVNIQPEDAKKDAGYAFGLLLHDGDQPQAVMVALPLFDVFSQAVEQGKLKGEVVNKSEIKLTASHDELQAFLQASQVGSQFNLKNLLTFTRIPGVKIEDKTPPEDKTPASEKP